MMTTVLAPAPATVEVTIADDLLRAAEVFEEWGWCQGRARSRDGEAFCVMGAIAFVTGVPPLAIAGGIEEPTLRFERATGVLLRLIPKGYLWNDKLGRTKAEVVAKLREAAEAARTAA